MSSLQTVWVFMAEGGWVPGGVFSSQERAEVWIGKNFLTGLLSELPVDIGVLDWAIAYAKFNPPSGKELSPTYVGRFTSGAVKNHHFENGVRIA